jgi:glycosyltransferase involved in cell wall biosynthesis
VVTNGRGTQGIDGARDGCELLVGETPDDLAAAAVRLLEDGEERVRLARAARSLVRREYTWERQIDRLLGLYESAARGPSAPRRGSERMLRLARSPHVRRPSSK